MKRSAMPWMPLGLALVMLLALSGTSAKAGEPTPEPTEYWEVGVEYVNWYHWWPWSRQNVWKTDDTALGLFNRLGRAGWSRRFQYGNRWAWEEDWKARWRGGTENVYIDTVDLAVFAGHGGEDRDGYYGRDLDGPVFGIGGRNHDDEYLTPGDARRAWGDGDLEWAVLHGCKILSDRSRPYWAAARAGIHLILGYKTSAFDADQGSPLGLGISWRWEIPQAWFFATRAAQGNLARSHNRTVVARVLAEDYCHLSDKWGSVCADSPDHQYWWWDHHVGSGPELSVNPADLHYELPVFDVVSAVPTDDYLDRLADAFGFSPTTPFVLDDEIQLYHATEGPLDLMVDKQGMYHFINLDQLWALPTNSIGLTDNPMSSSDARRIADEFLSTNDLMPVDAQFSRVLSDTLTSAEISETSSRMPGPLGMTSSFTQVHETISSTRVTGQHIDYVRQLIYTPTADSAVALPVFGPGAQLQVDINSSGEVVGAIGGWRALGSQATMDTINIMTPTQVVSLHNRLGNMINLAPTLFAADQVRVTNPTVGYYEQPMGATQSSLVPIYILDIEMLNTDTGGKLESTAFIPAAPELLPPLADITSVTDQQPEVGPGEIITLTAADASQPLSTLGYGDNLDFSLGEGPYTYTWKLETTGKVIGTGRSITYAAGIVDDLAVHKNNDVPMVIVLEVTDGARRTSSTAQPFYFIEMTPQVQRLYLPTVMKGR